MFGVRSSSYLYSSTPYKVYQLVIAMLKEAQENGTRGDKLVKFAGVMWQAFDPYHDSEMGSLIAGIFVKSAELFKVLSS